MDSGSPVPRQPAPAQLTGWTLVQTAHRAARRFQQVFAAQGLSAHQFGVLVQLSIEPGVSQAALARRILITPQSMGHLLQQMETARLIRRTPAAGRGAAISVALTDHGRAKLTATYPAVGAINTPTALGLDDAEAATLNDLLHRVLAHLDDDTFEPMDHGI